MIKERPQCPECRYKIIIGHEGREKVHPLRVLMREKGQIIKWQYCVYSFLRLFKTDPKLTFYPQHSSHISGNGQNRLYKRKKRKKIEAQGKGDQHWASVCHLSPHDNGYGRGRVANRQDQSPMAERAFSEGLPL